MITRLYAEEAQLKRRQERKKDRDRIRTERRIPGGFAWRNRYDAKYILAYARANNWSASRLRKAVDVVDEKERIARNAKLRRKRG